MSEITKLVVVALDHLTLRWQDRDIDPKAALALGVVMNFRAKQAAPELSKVTADTMIYGAGFYRVDAEKLKHIPFNEFASPQ